MKSKTKKEEGNNPDKPQYINTTTATSQIPTLTLRMSKEGIFFEMVSISWSMEESLTGMAYLLNAVEDICDELKKPNSKKSSYTG